MSFLVACFVYFSIVLLLPLTFDPNIQGVNCVISSDLRMSTRGNTWNSTNAISFTTQKIPTYLFRHHFVKYFQFKLLWHDTTDRKRLAFELGVINISPRVVEEDYGRGHAWDTERRWF